MDPQQTTQDQQHVFFSASQVTLPFHPKLKFHSFGVYVHTPTFKIEI